MLPPVQPYREIDVLDRDKTVAWFGMRPLHYQRGDVTALASVIYQLPKPDKDERR